MLNRNKGLPDRTDFSLAKKYFLRKTSEYQVVYQRGRRLRGKYFSLIYLPNNRDVNRLGISIHGVKKAVQRNRIKRVIREFFRLNRHFISPQADIVFAVRKEFSINSPDEMERTVKNLLDRQRKRESDRTAC
ncbi:MAG: ribonuclease P protein component [Thermodesulfobacteriota bacterium]|nr:ribonuclease P protein component [Thermodesulfobacteriota bacterium]